MTWMDIEYKENLIISFDKIWKDRKKQTNYILILQQIKKM